MLIILFAKKAKSELDGKKHDDIFYDKDTTPIKTVHFGAAGFADYTVGPQDEDTNQDSSKT